MKKKYIIAIVLIIVIIIALISYFSFMNNGKKYEIEKVNQYNYFELKQNNLNRSY